MESVVEGLEQFAGYHLRIRTKNENYIAERVDQKGETVEEVLAVTPDLIAIVDSNTGGVPTLNRQLLTTENPIKGT